MAGWQRIGVTTNARPAAFLSAIPAEGEIDGFTFSVPEAAWPDINTREAAYDQLSLGNEKLIFSVPKSNQTPGEAPILRSYLDVVLQGFEAVFGPDSLERFIATTQSWERGIYDDRAAPLYPRAQKLTVDETARYDALLVSVPVVRELM